MVKSRLEKRIIATPHGLRFFRSPNAAKSDRKSPAKRGNISSFSAHTALRLRQALFAFQVPNSFQVALTFTLPWKYSDEGQLDLYRKCFNRFRTRFIRAFPNSGFIFRHELQKRRVPHFHAMAYFDFVDLPSSLCSDFLPCDYVPLLVSWIRESLTFHWLQALSDTLSDDDFVKSYYNAVDVTYIAGKIHFYRYVSDHTSKHKRDQLGYAGKQWGFVNRKIFQNSMQYVVDCPGNASLTFITRSIRRLNRYTVSTRPGRLGSVRLHCPFGCRKTFRRFPASISFVDWSTVVKLVSYYNRRKASLGFHQFIRIRYLSSYEKFKDLFSSG